MASEQKKSKSTERAMRSKGSRKRVQQRIRTDRNTDRAWTNHIQANPNDQQAKDNGPARGKKAGR